MSVIPPPPLYDMDFNSLAWKGWFTKVSSASIISSWRDQLSDVISLQQTGPGVTRNDTECTVDFAQTSNLLDFMFLNVQLNHDKDLTAAIYPHIHWFQAAAQSPNFLLRYRWQTNGGTKVTAWTDLKCNTLEHTWTSGTIHQISEADPISVPADTFLSDIVQFKIYRDNANASGVFTGADAYAATVGVLAFDVHFVIDSVGSTREYIK